MKRHDADNLPPSNQANARRYELDWLRALVVLGLIPYHAAVVFAIGPGDYVKNAQRSLVFDVAATLVSFWGMPLLFFVAGAATWFALGRRAPRRYLAERTLRLAVPFVVGVFALVPVQLYFERRALPGFNLNYVQFYGGYLVDWIHIAQHGVFGLGFQYWGHLWFVLYLFAVSVLLLPLLLWLRGAGARRALTALSLVVRNGHTRLSMFLPTFIIFALFGAPFALAEATLQGPIGPRASTDYANLYSGPAGLVLYAVAFIIGYVLYADRGFQGALARLRWMALALALMLLALHEGLLLATDQQFVSDPWGSLLIRVLRGYITWLCLVAILGFALRRLAVDTPALRYLTEASLPLYVLHMPILTVIGFYLVSWDIPLAAKFFLLVVATVGATFGVYEGAIRRIPFARVLFGLKPQNDGHQHERPTMKPRIRQALQSIATAPTRAQQWAPKQTAPPTAGRRQRQSANPRAISHRARSQTRAPLR